MIYLCDLWLFLELKGYPVGALKQKVRAKAGKFSKPPTGVCAKPKGGH